MHVLVTGGAGFIGSVVTQRLIERGHSAVVMDNLAHGHRDAVHPDARFEEGDLLDFPFLQRLLAGGDFDAVVHLAAEARIDDSIRDPGLFYRVNVVGGVHLLDAMMEAGVKRMVFSSTAAIYGEPDKLPITEDDPHEPVNAYGESKLAFERALAWYRRAHDLRHISLRYFNACGATERFGESRAKETHIIPLLFDVAMGSRGQFSIFGTDYDTPDGTCVRDYIHVSDIAKAHVLGLEQIDQVGAAAYNMGNGSGFSNLQVIEAVRKVTGKAIDTGAGDRRLGDPARLVAGAERLRQQLGWEPDYPELEAMIQTAWDWRVAHPEGYAE